MLQEEVRRKGGKGHSASPFERPGDPTEDGAVLVADEPEPALAQRYRRVELGLERQGPGVAALEGGACGRVRVGDVDEALRNVDPHDFDAALGQGVGVA